MTYPRCKTCVSYIKLINNKAKCRSDWIQEFDNLGAKDSEAFAYYNPFGEIAMHNVGENFGCIHHQERKNESLR